MHSIDFIEVQRILSEVCANIDDSKFLPDRVVALSPNGVFVGKMISEYFDLPLTCVSWNTDGIECESNCWLPEDAIDGQQLLIVMDKSDDKLIDGFCKDWDSSSCGGDWEYNVRYVTMIKDGNSDFNFDYVGITVEDVMDVKLPYTQWWS